MYRVPSLTADQQNNLQVKQVVREDESEGLDDQNLSGIVPATSLS